MIKQLPYQQQAFFSGLRSTLPLFSLNSFFFCITFDTTALCGVSFFSAFGCTFVSRSDRLRNTRSTLSPLFALT